MSNSNLSSPSRRESLQSANSNQALINQNQISQDTSLTSMPSPAHSLTQTQSLSQPQLQQIKVKIKAARFTPTGGIFNSKADIYIEMIVDGTPSRKTEIARKTWSPEWNEDFDM